MVHELYRHIVEMEMIVMRTGAYPGGFHDQGGTGVLRGERPQRFDRYGQKCRGRRVRS